MQLPDHGRRTLPHHPIHTTFNQSTIVYVSMNAAGRRPILSRPEAVQLILETWSEASSWLVGRYVIMPDHLHFFCAPYDVSTPLKEWMHFWRATVTRKWPFAGEKPIWQKDFFDRKLRSDESYTQNWNYLWQNPVVASHCTDPAAWPYQGELNRLVWHEPA